MKAGLLSIAALSAVVVAQPQHGAHRHRHAKKEADNVVYVTDVVTATAPTKMVWVDQYGNTISADWPGATEAAVAPASYNNDKVQSSSSSSYEAPAAYSAPAPSAASSYEAPAAYSAPAPSAASSYEAPAAYSAPAASSTQSASESTQSSYSSSTGSEGSSYGITYSPYNSDNSCKSKDQIAKDLATISGYDMFRMYGVDCDQAGPIIKAAKSKNMKVFAGLYEITDVEAQIAKLKTAVESEADWSIIDTVSVGNEGVNNGLYSVDAVKAAVNSAKAALPSAYTGSVVTVDTFIAIINNPGLCSVGDYTAANCHAFFDGGVTADKSGAWVLEQSQRVSEACGGRKVVITEAGWPSSGSTNGKAVPSTENQKAAVEDLKSHFTSNLILFTAFNDYWKENSAATYGVEQHWGIYGDCPSS
jgi:exo-beta-1,3-glucanase (GH17 family)